MTQQTEKQKTQHIARLNKLTPAAKTSLILDLQKEADNRLQINENLRKQVKAEIDNANQKDITIAELQNDIKTIQARHVAEERMSSSMKSAFITVQARYITLLEKNHE